MGFRRYVLVGVFTGIYVRKLSYFLKLKAYFSKIINIYDMEYNGVRVFNPHPVALDATHPEQRLKRGAR
jgi:hypothetical protein